MVATRIRRNNGGALRTAILWICLGLAYVAALFYYKEKQLNRFVETRSGELRKVHAEFESLFQASFYFFYRDQFVPGVKTALKKVSDLDSVQILNRSGEVLFDSSNTDHLSVSNGGDIKLVPHASTQIIGSLKTKKAATYVSNFSVDVLIPSDQFSLVYRFDASEIRSRVFLIFAAGVLAVLLGGWVIRFLTRTERLRVITQRRWFGLRPKFLATIVVINFITGIIVFVTLTQLQTREESQRLRRESVLFSQFSTDKVVSDFSNHFYFYFKDRFLPAIRRVIATNENLVGLKIVSHRTGTVRFDSEVTTEIPDLSNNSDQEQVVFSPEFLSSLETRGIATREQTRDGERLLSVVNLHRNENQEPLFYVEFLFSFHTLERSVAAIRRQILIDLIPSMILGFIIAIAFAQLLISPVRKLASALRKVRAGDFDVQVDIERSDEIGELIEAFNAMTQELRKKKELRKYLSDSTYRQIMEAPETGTGTRLKGSRVSATVLFSDIRNFVGHCEKMDAEEITSMLNEYFTEMVEVVYKYQGEVDKFIGDALLAVFYTDRDPQKSTSTSLQAVYCALEMRERLRKFNDRRAQLGKETIEIGVGITHGEIISGPIGSRDRRDFTVIGDVVNLANRIEKLSKKGQFTKIVFSNHVEERVRGLLDCEEIGEEKVRGKEEKLKVYELVRIRDLETILKNVHSDERELRIRSVDLLGHTRNPEALPHLIELLRDGEEDVRLTAVSAISRLVKPGSSSKMAGEAMEAVFSVLETEKSRKVLSGLISTLGKLCRSERILELAPFLNSTDERIVANAVEAIGESRRPEASDLIVPKLGSVHNRVKANAAMALFAAGRVEVVDSLKPMLMHSDPKMRSSAAFALGELSILAKKDYLLDEWRKKGREVKVFLGELQECVPMLVNLLKDSEPMVKRQAVVALGKMKDKSAVLPIIDCIDLERDSKELIQDVGDALRAIGSHRLVREVLEKLS